MKPSTLTAAILLLTTTLLNSCDFDDYRGYQQTYYPNPAAVFAKFDNPSSPSALNPAHGQPGHRCDLPVGSPLPSPPVKNDLYSKNFTPVTQNLPSSTPGLLKTAPSSNPALNPAHGQPGHRCDIPIGAPLNSAPVKAKANSPSPGTPAVATTSAPGLNPPHGQPGHRCDIAAGAPLNAPARENTDTSKTTPQVIIPPNTDSSQVSTFTGSSGPIVQLNPPHGPPGHACTIPVGKLLKQ